MLYDRLLLSCGGGVIPEIIRGTQYTDRAALVIGIGGVGIAALSELKGKLHRQLRPDDPNDPVPGYDGIQLLGIDSDETEYQEYRGSCRLSDEEFFPLRDNWLQKKLMTKQPVKSDPRMDWMDIDHMPDLIAPVGAGGIRQVGRYLLLSKAEELRRKIEHKCMAALMAHGRSTLDVYVLAGLSGGTGSGCFLDICYMVRQIIRCNGWNTMLHGYFFLPDVVLSKGNAGANPATVAYNNANGYAALKELDYLMGLEDANDRFVQQYSPAFKVDTQEPPVDICCLICALKDDGSVRPDGFSYAVGLAADSIMMWLTETEPVDMGGTIRSRMAQLQTAMRLLPRTHGANGCYQILGVGSAEVPVGQFFTYLSAGAYGRFTELAKANARSVDKAKVTELAEGLGLTAEKVRQAVSAGTVDLNLPEADYRELFAAGIPSAGAVHAEWARYANAWLDRCGGRMEINANSLTQALDNFNYNTANEASLVGRLFRKLWELSVDPQFGPYYAAQLLHNGSYDLISHLDSAIRCVKEQIVTCMEYGENAGCYLEDVKEAFYHRSSLLNRRSKYAHYADAAAELFRQINAVRQCEKTLDVLAAFKRQAQALYTEFFRPLCQVLDNLEDTFRENQSFLRLQNGGTSSRQILTLEDVRGRLNQAIGDLTDAELIGGFTRELLENSDVWRGGDPDRLCLLVRRYMLRLFPQQTERSLRDYLLEKYPHVRNLAQTVLEDILDQLHDAAAPAFWTDPTFDLANTWHFGALDVPATGAEVCQAAQCFGIAHAEYVISGSGIGDRITAVRMYCGVPLYAYQGITHLKQYYDAAADMGNHLYACTGRGECCSDRKDWRHFLPEPLPYSVCPERFPDHQQLLELYDKGKNSGIIREGEEPFYWILRSAPVDARLYTLAELSENGRFDREEYDTQKARLQQLERDLHKKENCTVIRLGQARQTSLGQALADRVCCDDFLRYPMLQQVVREELDKLRLIRDSLGSLEAAIEAFRAGQEKH